MEQNNYNIKRKKHKHILREDRYLIEKLLNSGFELEKIMVAVGCSQRTLEREIVRGTWEYLDSSTYEMKTKYSWDVAQKKHEETGKNKGRYPKINDNPELRKYVEQKIKKEKYSPEASLLKAKEDGYIVDITVKTLYNNIDSGDIDVSRKDLLRKNGWKQDKSKPRKALNNLKGESIENRPENANNRSEFGHWEMDLIVSCRGGKGALLTLTERKTRLEISIKLPDKTQKSVQNALDKLEKRHGNRFKEKFKTITTDNGSEFLDFESLEKSCRCDEKRFKIYYAHPFSSWERGSNENANGIIRRFFPKGSDFSKISIKKIQNVEDWMNNYPRRILGGLNAFAAEKLSAP